MHDLLRLGYAAIQHHDLRIYQCDEVGNPQGKIPESPVDDGAGGRIDCLADVEDYLCGQSVWLSLT